MQDSRSRSRLRYSATPSDVHVEDFSCAGVLMRPYSATHGVSTPPGYARSAMVSRCSRP